MLFKVIEAENVKLELLELMLFYEKMKYGLGDRIIQEYQFILNSLQSTAYHHFNYSKTIRRVLFNKFPLGVFYKINGSIVEIISVKDMRVHPNKFPK